MAVSYTLRWPGLPSLPVYIIDTEKHMVYGHHKPLPLSALDMNVLGNKYVKERDLLQLFMPASREQVGQELHATIKRENILNNLYKHIDGHHYVHLTAFLIFILVYPMCIEFQKTRKAVFNFLMRYPEVPCLDCGYVKRDCLCGDDTISVDDVGAFESQEVVAKLTDLKDASTQARPDCPLCMNKLMYNAWSEGKGPVVIMPRGQKITPNEKLPAAVANALSSGKLSQGANFVAVASKPEPLKISCPPVTHGEPVRNPFSVLNPQPLIGNVSQPQQPPSKVHELTVGENKIRLVSLTSLEGKKVSSVTNEKEESSKSESGNGDKNMSVAIPNSSLENKEGTECKDGMHVSKDDKSISKDDDLPSKDDTLLSKDEKSVPREESHTPGSSEMDTSQATTISAVGHVTNVSGLSMNWIPLNQPALPAGNVLNPQSGMPQMTAQLPGGMTWVRLFNPSGGTTPMCIPYPQPGSSAPYHMYPMMGTIPGTNIHMASSAQFGMPTSQQMYPMWQQQGNGKLPATTTWSGMTPPGFPSTTTWSGMTPPGFPATTTWSGMTPPGLPAASTWSGMTPPGVPPNTTLSGMTPPGLPANSSWPSMTPNKQVQTASPAWKANIRKPTPPLPGAATFVTKNKLAPYVVHPADLTKKKKKKKRLIGDGQKGGEEGPDAKKPKLLLDESCNPMVKSESTSQESTPSKESSDVKEDANKVETTDVKGTTPEMKTLSKTKKLSRSLTDLSNLSVSFLNETKNSADTLLENSTGTSLLENSAGNASNEQTTIKEEINDTNLESPLTSEPAVMTIKVETGEEVSNKKGSSDTQDCVDDNENNEVLDKEKSLTNMETLSTELPTEPVMKDVKIKEEKEEMTTDSKDHPPSIPNTNGAGIGGMNKLDEQQNTSTNSIDEKDSGLQARAPNSTDKEVADVLLAMSVLGTSSALPLSGPDPSEHHLQPDKETKQETLQEKNLRRFMSEYESVGNDPPSRPGSAPPYIEHRPHDYAFLLDFGATVPSQESPKDKGQMTPAASDASPNTAAPDVAIKLSKAAEQAVKFKMLQPVPVYVGKGFGEFEFIETGELMIRCTLYNCGQCFDTEDYAKLHVKCHHGTKRTALKCPEKDCEFTVPCVKWYHMLRHLKQTHKIEIAVEALQCDLCGLKFEDEEKLKWHFGFHHLNNYKCIHCGGLLYSWNHVQHHLSHCGDKEKGHFYHSCPYCHVVFHSAANRDMHITSHMDKGLMCTYCNDDKVWDKWMMLKKHYEMFHMSAKHKVLHKCLQCRMQFLSKEKFDRHMKKHEKAAAEEKAAMEAACEEEEEEGEGEEGGTHECDICLKQFRTKHNLTWHLDNVHGKEMRCESCTFVARSKLVMRSHQRQKHGEKRHACSECDDSFVFAHQLREHLVTKHDKVLKFSCGKCKDEFDTEADLSQHMFSEHTPAPPPVPKKRLVCSLCPFSCMSRTTLRAHRKNKHIDPEEEEGEKLQEEMPKAQEVVEHKPDTQAVDTQELPETKPLLVAKPPPKPKPQTKRGKYKRKRGKRKLKAGNKEGEPSPKKPRGPTRKRQSKYDNVVAIRSDRLSLKKQRREQERETARRQEEQKRLDAIARKTAGKRKMLSCARTRTIDEYREMRRREGRTIDEDPLSPSQRRRTLSTPTDYAATLRPVELDHNYCMPVGITTPAPHLARSYSMCSEPDDSMEIMQTPEVLDFQECATQGITSGGRKLKALLVAGEHGWKRQTPADNRSSETSVSHVASDFRQHQVISRQHLASSDSFRQHSLTGRDIASVTQNGTSTVVNISGGSVHGVPGHMNSVSSAQPTSSLHPMSSVAANLNNPPSDLLEDDELAGMDLFQDADVRDILEAAVRVLRDTPDIDCMTEMQDSEAGMSSSPPPIVQPKVKVLPVDSHINYNFTSQTQTIYTSPVRTSFPEQNVRSSFSRVINGGQAVVTSPSRHGKVRVVTVGRPTDFNPIHVPDQPQQQVISIYTGAQDSRADEPTVMQIDTVEETHESDGAEIVEQSLPLDEIPAPTTTQMAGLFEKHNLLYAQNIASIEPAPSIAAVQHSEIDSIPEEAIVLPEGMEEAHQAAVVVEDSVRLSANLLGQTNMEHREMLVVQGNNISATAEDDSNADVNSIELNEADYKLWDEDEQTENVRPKVTVEKSFLMDHHYF